MELIISNLTSFDPNHLEKYLFCGPWCFKGLDELVLKNESRIKYLPAPYNSKEDLKNAQQRVFYYSDRHLRRYAKKWGSPQTGIDAVRYWHGLLMPWLITMVDHTIRYYDQIRKLNFKGKYCVRILKDNQELKFPTTLNLMNRIRTDEWLNHWILSRVIESLNLKNIKIKYLDIQPSFQDDITQKKLTFYSLLKQFIINAIKKYIILTKNILLGNVYGIEVSYFLHLMFRLKRIKKSKKINKRHSFESNNITTDVLLDSLLENILYRTLPVNLKPEKICKRHVKYYLAVSSVDHWYNDHWKMDVAYNCDTVTTVGVNHGGNGISEIEPIANELEYKGLDYFFTPGNADGDNCIPIPMPALSRISNTYERCNDNIIFVCNPSYYNARGIYSGYRFSDFEHPIYKANRKVNFINTLNHKIRNNLILRPYFTYQHQFNETEYIKSKIPEVPLLYGDLHEEMKFCALIVMDHYSTTIPIAMAMNVPIILFWDERRYLFKRNPSIVMDLMRKNGMLFNDQSNAANHINNTYDSIDRWWSLEKIQDVRYRFCQEMAMFHKDWRKIFINELNKIIESKNSYEKYKKG